MATADGLEIVSMRTPGLGDTTYIATLDGIGLLVDPQRDIERFVSELDERRVDLRWVLETHLHNDYVSGATAAARSTGAELVVPAATAPAYRHTPAYHMEDFSAGHLTIRPLHTPGHTPEHTSYLLLVDDEKVAVFTGGSLLVGSAGRPDLLGPEQADSLARLQYRSVRRLARLPRETGLYPTHGAGSFCTVAAAGSLTSTIGAEIDSNPVLSHTNEDAFVIAQLGDLAPYPSYYAQMGPINLFGAAPMPAAGLPTIEASNLTDGPQYTIIDGRPRQRFAAAHVAGSIGIELSDDFATWTGWLTEPDAPLALVLEPGQSLEEATTQLARIGRDDLAGVTWVESLDDQMNTASFRTTTVAEFAAAAERGEQILDVRSPQEWVEGHIQGSLHHYLPELATSAPAGIDRNDPVWVACGSGFRSSIAASFLVPGGYDPIVLTDGGVAEVLARLSTGAREG